MKNKRSNFFKIFLHHHSTRQHISADLNNHIHMVVRRIGCAHFHRVDHSVHDRSLHLVRLVEKSVSAARRQQASTGRLLDRCLLGRAQLHVHASAVSSCHEARKTRQEYPIHSRMLHHFGPSDRRTSHFFPRRCLPALSG